MSEKTIDKNKADAILLDYIATRLVVDLMDTLGATSDIDDAKKTTIAYNQVKEITKANKENV